MSRWDVFRQWAVKYRWMVDHFTEISEKQLSQLCSPHVPVVPILCIQDNRWFMVRYCKIVYVQYYPARIWATQRKMRWALDMPRGDRIPTKISTDVAAPSLHFASTPLDVSTTSTPFPNHCHLINPWPSTHRIQPKIDRPFWRVSTILVIDVVMIYHQ